MSALGLISRRESKERIIIFFWFIIKLKGESHVSSVSIETFMKFGVIEVRCGGNEVRTEREDFMLRSGRNKITLIVIIDRGLSIRLKGSEIEARVVKKVVLSNQFLLPPPVGFPALVFPFFFCFFLSSWDCFFRRASSFFFCVDDCDCLFRFTGF